MEDTAAAAQRLKALEKFASDFYQNIPAYLETHFPSIVLSIAAAALHDLRHYIEDDTEPDISWANPWVELHRRVLEYNWNDNEAFPEERRRIMEAEDPTAAIQGLTLTAADVLDTRALYMLTKRVCWRTRKDPSKGGASTSTLHLPEDEWERLRALPPAEREAAERELIAPITFGAFEVDLESEPTPGPTPAGVRAALAAGLETMHPLLAFDGTLEDGTAFSGSIVVQFHPLVADEDTREAYFPVVVGLVFGPLETTLAEGGAPTFPDPTAWSDADRTTFWDTLQASLTELVPAPEPATTGTTGTTGTLGTMPTPAETPPAARPGWTPVVPVAKERREAVRRSMLEPYPVPRRVAEDSLALALTRGLGPMFAGGYAKVPDLDRRGELACKEAERLFWDAVEKAADATAPGWQRETLDGKTVLVLPVDEEKARSFWGAVTKSLNATPEEDKEGPGIHAEEPHFENRTHWTQGRVVHETALTFWPDEAFSNKYDEPRAAVRFRRETSPGYQALLSERGKRPFFADGWLWIPRGTEREGFRIGGLSTLLFPEGRGALERLQTRNLKDYEGRLHRIFQEPSLFQDTDKLAVRDLQAAVRRAKAWLRELSVYDIGPDLLLCVFEAFHRQRDTWANEQVELKDGHVVNTRPWRIIRLDPADLRVRLDPDETKWGKNWRGELFNKLEALTTFQRQTRTSKGRKVDVGDRFLGRVIDGRREIDEKDTPETNPRLGLVRALDEAKALPVDAFFVEVSVDFMRHLVAWSEDEKGGIHWGMDAAKAAERKALLVDKVSPDEAREEARKKRAHARATPYTEGSPRLMTLSNLEKWPLTRKLLAYVLLGELTPNFQRYRSRNGTSRTRRKPNRLGGMHALITVGERDFVACNGKHGNGYRVKAWMDKVVGYEKRTGPGGGASAFHAFVKDLDGLTDTLVLYLELGPVGGRTLRSTDALRALYSYTRNPPSAYNLKLKLYLPADREDRLRARLKKAGIEDAADTVGPHVFTPTRPGGIAPKDLHIARLQAKWTQAELAAKVGVSQAVVAYWETAKRPIPPDREAALREVLADHLKTPSPDPPL